MLGYVIIDKDELKVKEYDIYQSYYCGICKSIAKRVGQIPRMTLSYDAVFLAIVLASINDEEDIINQEHCILHPVEKRPVARNNSAIDYAADMMVILAYHKFNDDWQDDHSIMGFTGRSMLTISYKKLHKQYPEVCSSVEYALKKLSELEKEHSGSIDKTADAFADIMGVLFTGFYNDKKLNRVLSQFGRGLGKWIYTIDALDDYNRDKEKKQYNPLIYRKSGLKDIDILLYNYLGEVMIAYDLLDISKNRGIIDNILFRGLRAKTDSVFRERTIEYEKSI